ncbi:hypothetical protein KSF_099450 [Reticulibacter mediterranei]|uniref:Uncharacterized protein n=1 Tax=Reticulibacter mediterranei TaxID=2778369 RepID=A0A8J3J027_9CHLR|nr:hypothetical protein KSF_099450 [Reticulibacter mediterranei]
MTHWTRWCLLQARHTSDAIPRGREIGQTWTLFEETGFTLPRSLSCGKHDPPSFVTLGLLICANLFCMGYTLQ